MFGRRKTSDVLGIPHAWEVSTRTEWGIMWQEESGFWTMTAAKGVPCVPVLAWQRTRDAEPMREVMSAEWVTDGTVATFVDRVLGQRFGADERRRRQF